MDSKNLSDAFPDLGGFDRFMDPFGPFGRPNRQAIGHRATNNRNQQQQLASRDNFMSNPFALMNQMMGNMNNMFGNMDQLMNDPNAQVFSSSTVMTYSNTGNGAPKVYQASSQTTQLPGGIRETRKAVRDSEKGVDRMAIGHHIGNKAHIIERQKNRDGHMEEVVNLENIDDSESFFFILKMKWLMCEFFFIKDEVNEFDREFEERIRGGYTNNRHLQITDNHHRNRSSNQPLAIDDGHKKYESPNKKQNHIPSTPKQLPSQPQLSQQKQQQQSNPLVQNPKAPRSHIPLSRSQPIPSPQAPHHRFLRPNKQNPNSRKVPFKF